MMNGLGGMPNPYAFMSGAVPQSQQMMRPGQAQGLPPAAPSGKDLKPAEVPLLAQIQTSFQDPREGRHSFQDPSSHSTLGQVCFQPSLSWGRLMSVSQEGGAQKRQRQEQSSAEVKAEATEASQFSDSQSPASEPGSEQRHMSLGPQGVGQALGTSASMHSLAANGGSTNLQASQLLHHSKACASREHVDSPCHVVL